MAHLRPFDMKSTVCYSRSAVFLDLHTFATGHMWNANTPDRSTGEYRFTADVSQADRSKSGYAEENSANKEPIGRSHAYHEGANPSQWDRVTCPDATMNVRSA
ncbi:MAG: hypothetical protein JWN03_4092 [Nocardia sp.]|nr:hypothetical protein [Nocardia sp.]